MPSLPALAEIRPCKRFLSSLHLEWYSFLWDVATGKTIRRFLGHTHRVNAVDFNSDSSVLASGSYDASVRLWDCKYDHLSTNLIQRSQNRVPIQVLEDAKDSVTSVQIKNFEIITGSVDGRLRTYDLRAGQLSTDVVGRLTFFCWTYVTRSDYERLAIIRQQLYIGVNLRFRHSPLR